MAPRVPILFFIALSCSILSFAPAAAAQSSDEPVDKGAVEWGFQTGGGVAVAGGARDRSYWMLAGRWGYVLTPELTRSPLRGSIEYSVEATPIFLMAQSSTVYAAGFTPLQFRYNFTAPRRLIPYFEIGSGVLFSTSKIPEGSSSVNFASHGGFGMHWMRGESRSVTAGFRYVHISNANLGDINPGINSIYFYTWLSWWR